MAQSPASEDSQRLWRRFHKHRKALLLFLKREDVPPTNNASEQALRNRVIYRKVTGGFCSDWGLNFMPISRLMRYDTIDNVPVGHALIVAEWLGVSVEDLVRVKED